MRKRKSQKAPKTTSGRVFSSNHTTPGVSFAAALRSNTQQEQQPHPSPVAQACPVTVGEMSAPPPFGLNQRQAPSQSDLAPIVNNSSLHDIFNLVGTVFQHIMTDLNGAE
jgi:hypothetical protein